MLTGRPAFGADTVPTTIAAILDREPDWRRLPETTPASVVGLLRRCLEKDPARRLENIADARSALDSVLEEPPFVPADGRRYSLTRFAVGAALLALIALAVMPFVIASRSRPGP